MEKQPEATTEKKGIWAIIKESMNKASSGCGPTCGCHSEKPASKSPVDSATAGLSEKKEG